MLPSSPSTTSDLTVTGVSAGRGPNGLALGRSAVLSSKLFPQVEALWRGLTQGHWVEDRPARQVKTAKHEG